MVISKISGYIPKAGEGWDIVYIPLFSYNK